MVPSYLTLLLLASIALSRCSISTFNIPPSIPISGTNALQHPTEIIGTTSLIYYIHHSQLIDDSSITPILYAFIESAFTSKAKCQLTLLVSAGPGQLEQMQMRIMKLLTDIVQIRKPYAKLEDILEVRNKYVKSCVMLSQVAIIDVRDTAAIESMQSQVSRDQSSNKGKSKANGSAPASVSDAEANAALGARELIDSLLTVVADKMKSLGASPSLATLTTAFKDALSQHSSTNADKIEKLKGTKALQDAGSIARVQLAGLLESHFRRVLTAYVSASKVNFDRGAAKILPGASLKSKLRKLAETVHAKFVASAAALQKGDR